MSHQRMRGLGVWRFRADTDFVGESYQSVLDFRASSAITWCFGSLVCQRAILLTFSFKAISHVFEKATNAVSVSHLINKIDTIKEIHAHMQETDSVVNDLQARTEQNRTTTADNTARIAALEAEIAAIKAQKA